MMDALAAMVAFGIVGGVVIGGQWLWHKLTKED